MVHIGPCVVRTRVTVTLIIYSGEIALKTAVRQVKTPLHRVDGAGASDSGG